MLQIAMCDDDETDLLFLSDTIDKYCRTYEIEIKYTCFSSGDMLLAAVKGGSCFDICLLDIIMPKPDGIETARQLRTLLPQTELIYLTTSMEFSLAAYSVHALDYLVKPYTNAQLFSALERARTICRAKKNTPRAVFPLPTREGILRVNLKEILYVQSQNKILKFHLEDGRVLKTANSSMTLGQAAHHLAEHGDFFMPSRSYIVNLSAMVEVTRDYLELCNGAQLPVPRRKYNEIKHIFLNFLLKTEVKDLEC